MPDIIKIMKQRVLETAFRGELVKQHPEDGNAKDLIARIQSEKEKLIKEKKIKKETNFPDISKEELRYDIPPSWIWTRLGEIGDWGAGATPKRGNPAFWNNGTIPWLKTGELNNSYINTSEEFITEEAFKGSSVRLNKPGDILIAMYGATIGKLGILEIEATTNQACCACTTFNGVYNMYLFYYLMASKQSFIESSEGGAQPNISRTKIIRHVMPLPPYLEQKRIVSKIEEIFSIIDKIAERKEDALHTIHLIRQTTLQQAIQGKLVEQNEQDEPISELIERIEKEKDKLIKEKIIRKGKPTLPISEEDIPFKLPDNWSWVRLGEVVSFKIGKTPRRAQANYWGEGIPWISISDINSDRISITNEEVTDRAIEEVFKDEISKKDTLIMSFKLTIGKTAILDIDAVHNEAIISIFPFVDYDNCFRNYLLHVLPLVSNKGDFKSAIKGNTLNSTSITNLMIPLPPLSEQKLIVEKIEQILKICDQMEELFK